MKLFGHYVPRRFLILAGLDGAMFVLALLALGLAPPLGCETCGLTSLGHLAPWEMALLTGGFLLTTTAVGLYNSDAAQDFRTFLRRFVLAWQALFIPSVAFFAVTKFAAGLPFGWYVGVTFLAITLFMAVLFALHLGLIWCLGLSFMRKRVMVLGEGEEAEAVSEHLRLNGGGRFTHVRTISSRRTTEHARLGNLILAAPRSEAVPISRLAEILRADEIVVAVADRRGLPVEELLECKLRGVNVVDSLTFWERETGRIDPAQAGAGWLTFNSGMVFNQRRRLLKRAIDLTERIAFLVAVLPLTLLTAAAIKLESRGPIFYRQERVGLNGRVFRLWKFRSMRVDAERDGVPRWAGSTDDRVTRVGRFIRKVRIDEIPQVINVLAGDMSFIGPRPERPFFVDQLREVIPNYDLRHRVRPGITGWAQINYPYGASVEDARRKLAFDLYYLKKNDLLLDCAILVQTVRVVLLAHGAR